MEIVNLGQAHHTIVIINHSDKYAAESCDGAGHNAQWSLKWLVHSILSSLNSHHPAYI